ncbi:FtsW/RodA/SpoVE family cell cycle protein, partial [Raoultella terrigena]|uniref:FtsW/RodA/SpoVE family cell cycle protein n=1 Tax=Raoultella terrigena TaxID=577 RepID=UPI001C6FDAEE
GMGFVAALLTFQVPMSVWERVAPWLFIASILLLVAVLVPHVGTVVNGARAEASKPQVGWLNSQLYTLPAVQQTFRDITVGVTDRQYEAGPGWDIPTGWGAPDAEGLLRTLP